MANTSCEGDSVIIPGVHSLATVQEIMDNLGKYPQGQYRTAQLLYEIGTKCPSAFTADQLIRAEEYIENVLGVNLLHQTVEDFSKEIEQEG